MNLGKKSSVSKRTPCRSGCYSVALLAVTAFTSGCSRKKAEVAPVPNVRSVSATRSIGRQVPITLSETGTFVADELSNVAPAVAGRVIRTPVSVGAFVKAGAILCELDHRDAEFKLVQARAQLGEATAAVRQAQSRIGLDTGSFEASKVPEVAAARANYESSEAQARMAAADAKRYSNLVATGDVSQSVYEKQRTQAETAAAQANAARQQYEAAANGARQSNIAISSSQSSLEAVRSQVLLAEKALSDTTIRAPFDGFVSARPVAVGEYVSLTSTVATIVRVGVLKLQLQVPEKSSSGLRVGMPVTAQVAAYSSRDFQGATSALNPAVNPDSRALVLEARFPNAEGLLHPGMFATARIVLPGTENAVLVPKSAIVRDRTTDSNQVFVVDGGAAHLRVVTIVDAGSDLVRILTGVAAGEMVATNKQSELYDSAPVSIQGER